MHILLYAINSIGIGHLSRLIAIAESLRSLDPSLKFLFLTEISDTRLLEDYGFPFYYVPPRKKVEEDKEYAALGTEKFSLREKVIQTVVAEFAPDLVLHDSLIDGVTFDVSKELGAAQVFITRARNNFEDFLIKMRNYLNYLDLFVVAEEVSVPLPIESVYRCQAPLLRRTISDIDQKSIRDKYVLKEEDLLLTICNGGGSEFKGSEDDFWEVIFEVLTRIDVSKLRILGITGPLSKNSFIVPDNITNIQLFDYEPFLPDLLSVSDFIISRGGYNTANELRMLRVPALAIPAWRKSDNQQLRLEKLAETLPFLQVSPLDAYSIETALVKLLRSHREEELDFSTDAYKQCKVLLAKRILSLL